MLEIEEDAKLHTEKKKEVKFEVSYQKKYCSYPQLERRWKNKARLKREEKNRLTAQF